MSIPRSGSLFLGNGIENNLEWEIIPEMTSLPLILWFWNRFAFEIKLTIKMNTELVRNKVLALQGITCMNSNDELMT